MDLLTILVKTKEDYNPEKHHGSIDLSDPYYDKMNKHYKDINKYIDEVCNNLKGAKRGEMMHYINNTLKSILDNSDLMTFVLEHLDEQYAYIDKF